MEERNYKANLEIAHNFQEKIFGMGKAILHHEMLRQA
jgi:hypothetical protein